MKEKRLEILEKEIEELLKLEGCPDEEDKGSEELIKEVIVMGCHPSRPFHAFPPRIDRERRECLRRVSF